MRQSQNLQLRHQRFWHRSLTLTSRLSGAACNLSVAAMHNSPWNLSTFFFKPIIERNAFHYEGCDDLAPNAAAASRYWDVRSSASNTQTTLKKNCGDEERLLYGAVEKPTDKTCRGWRPSANMTGGADECQAETSAIGVL